MHNLQQPMGSKSPSTGRILENEELDVARNLIRRRFGVELFILASLLSCGLLPLVSYWLPFLRMHFLYATVKPSDADYVSVRDGTGSAVVLPVKVIAVPRAEYASIGSLDSYRVIVYEGRRYIWSQETMKYEANVSMVEGLDSHLLARSTTSLQGLSSSEHQHRLVLFGPNAYSVQQPSKRIMLLELITSPFYVVQWVVIVFSLILLYYPLAALTTLFALISLRAQYTGIKRRWKVLKQLRRAHLKELRVIRDGGQSHITSATSLVPGDLVHFVGRMQVPADILLLKGHVEVDESALTGDPTSICRSGVYTSFPGVTSSSESDGDVPHIDSYYDGANRTDLDPHMLTEGTSIKQVLTQAGLTVGVVVRTGGSTQKGKSVSRALYGRKSDGTSIRNTNILLPGLIVGVIGAAVSAILDWNKIKAILGSRIGLDSVIFWAVITSASLVPPLLPFALYFRRRLAGSSVYAMKSHSVDMFGTVNCIAFDKTGTLTEPTFEIAGVVPVVDSKCVDMVSDRNRLRRFPQIIHLFACCHSLKRSAVGTATGDPLEVTLFRAARGMIDEAVSVGSVSFRTISSRHGIEYTIRVHRVFPFSSESRRMSVYATVEAGELRYRAVFTKGDSSVVMRMCKKNTVPGNFHETLRAYSHSGYRVLCMAMKVVSDNLSSDEVDESIDRNRAEHQLTFLGFVILENRLAQSAPQVVRTLSSAGLPSILVTGDQLYTALAVARSVGMIPSGGYVWCCDVVEDDCDGERRGSVEWYRVSNADFVRESSGPGEVTSVLEGSSASPVSIACTGLAFDVLRKTEGARQAALWKNLLCRCAVYTSMSPSQKGLLVKYLQGMGMRVAMVGDGANDSEALSEAHCGVSMSPVLDTVCAPFVCDRGNIGGILSLLREGRSSLAGTVHAFKLVIVFAFIIFSMLFHLTRFGSFLGNAEWTYLLVLGGMLLLPIPLMDSAYKISRDVPVISISSLSVLLSIGGQCLLVAMFHILIVRGFVRHCDTEVVDVHGLSAYTAAPRGSFFATVLFFFSCIQMIAVTVAYNVGPPFRAPLYRNRLLLVILIGMFTFTNLFTYLRETSLRTLGFDFTWCDCVRCSVHHSTATETFDRCNECIHPSSIPEVCGHVVCANPDSYVFRDRLLLLAVEAGAVLCAYLFEKIILRSFRNGTK